jgi:hypothetical protein
MSCTVLVAADTQDVLNGTGRMRRCLEDGQVRTREEDPLPSRACVTIPSKVEHACTMLSKEAALVGR